jgi:hypothetical protein
MVTSGSLYANTDLFRTLAAIGRTAFPVISRNWKTQIRNVPAGYQSCDPFGAGLSLDPLLRNYRNGFHPLLPDKRSSFLEPIYRFEIDGNRPSILAKAIITPFIKFSPHGYRLLSPAVTACSPLSCLYNLSPSTVWIYLLLSIDILHGSYFTGTGTFHF